MPKYDCSHRRFTHDCSRCKFIGHFCGHDVYTCSDQIDSPVLGPTILARYGNDGPDYASQPIRLFQESFTGNGKVQIGMAGDGKMLSFQDYLFSNYVVPYHKAMLLALASISRV